MYLRRHREMGQIGSVFVCVRERVRAGMFTLIEMIYIQLLSIKTRVAGVTYDSITTVFLVQNLTSFHLLSSPLL